MPVLMTASPDEITVLKQKITSLREQYLNASDHSTKIVLAARLDAHRAVLREWLTELEDDGDLMAYRSEDVI